MYNPSKILNFSPINIDMSYTLQYKSTYVNVCMYVRESGFVRKWASLFYSSWHIAITPQICCKINNNLSYEKKRKSCLGTSLKGIPKRMRKKGAKMKKVFYDKHHKFFNPFLAFLLFFCHSQLFHSISSHVNTEKAIKAIHEKPELNTTKILKY